MGKDKKRHKKKSHGHKKHHKKSKPKRTDDSSSSDEWVECDQRPSPSKSQTSPPQRLATDATREQEEWASNPALLACTSRDQLRQGREKKNDKNEQDKYMLDNVGRTDRELNPYWKDGGCGLPEEREATVESLRQAQVTVGDQGAAWLRKALQRATEQARDSGRPLDEVVAERWGSLNKLESMIAAAEERDKNKKFNITRRFPKKDEYREKNSSFSQRDTKHHERDNISHRDSHSKRQFSKPRGSSDESSADKKSSRSKRESERLNESYDRDSNRKNKQRTESGKVAKRNKGSSESSDYSSEEERSRNKRQRERTKPHKSFSKPRSNSSDSSSSSMEKGKTNPRKYKADHYDRERKFESSRRKFSKPSNSSDEDENSYRERDTGRDRSKSLDRNKSHDSKKKFVRPRHDSEEDDCKSKSSDNKSRDYKSFSSSGGGWRKKVESQKTDEVVVKDKPKLKTEETQKDSTSDIEDDKTLNHEAEPVLTDKELNELAAKLVKAEILGNQELVEELKAKLSKARETKAKAPKDSDEAKEVVILTHTDTKGFTRPVSLSGPLEPSGGRRKGKKVETHAGGKRMRYFADDDKYSLQEMFQREKLNTVEDSNEVFAKLASKGIGRDDSTRDMEDVFEETARVEESEGRQLSRERQKAVEQSRRTARTLDHCQWCLDSQHMLKHLIVAIGTTCYLCVPPYQSLTDHHCLIVPRTHTPCATQLDEDVWTEVQDFRKAVVAMFLSRDEDVVFFESARRLNQFPHMVLNCVPVPRETGDMAPIYFKKAIQECEQEWSNNKKLVELKGRDVRRAVPKGLPYFAVDFGLDSGYAHVIEDEQLFPQNFAQEIIGGMLDLDHTIWRKQRRQNFEEQSKKVIQLNKLWSPFDITKKK